MIRIDHQVYHCVRNGLKLLPVYMLMIIKKNRGTNMHGIINKACMEKFKTLTEEGKV